MLFNSVEFLMFFPVVTIVYMFIPQKLRVGWLLMASYFFYANWNVKYIFLLGGVTVVAYIAGRLLDDKKNKGIMIMTVTLLVVLLLIFKYLDFILYNTNRLFSANISALDILLPVGISFYVFQAIGYVIDVYRGKNKAERNFLVFALFISFFPQLVAGPIERASNIIPQFKAPYRFEYRKVVDGLVMIAYGLFQKIVIADRMGALVDPVFDNYTSYNGMCRIIAAIGFAIQIYCDFGGYSNIAIGCAKVMGINLMTNFKSPYLVTSIREFWQSWHISLSEWFRDYVYIPLGGNRKGKVRKYVNIMVTMLISGLWHGAAWHYVIWGTLHGLLQVIEDIMSPVFKKIRKVFKINPDTAVHIVLNRLVVFAIICVTWIVFRSGSVSASFGYLNGIWNVHFADVNTVFTLMGISLTEAVVILLSIGLLLIIDSLKKRGKNLLEFLSKQNTVERWAIYYCLVMAVIIFGYYGYEYEQAEFIYFQF